MKNSVLDFWFSEIDEKSWYVKDANLDKEIATRFSTLYEQASMGELFLWRETVEGRLAEIILLDQFSRNMFRNSSKAFQFDCVALALSQEASRLPESVELDPRKKAFLYMPFMHSESLVIHEHDVKLFSAPGLEMALDYELKHKEIIERFGRYPHRNQVLGRESTADEIEFLSGPNSSF